MSTQKKELQTTRYIFDTAANWAASNVPLRRGDFAIITDEPWHYKAGNGTSSFGGTLGFRGDKFSALPYITNSFYYKTLTPVAHNATGIATAAEILKGLITSTSAAAVALTLDTVANLVTALVAAYPNIIPTGGSANIRGLEVNFSVDNVLGASTITVGAGTGMTTASAITGGTTLTVAAGAEGKFRLYFVTATAAILSRVK